jgi:DNA (cytosine-5)-methyltransferase 1
MGAADVGANHQRDRIWIVGKISNTNKGRCTSQNKSSPIEETDNKTVCNGSAQQMADTNSTHGKGNQCAERIQQEHTNADSTSELAYTKNEGYVRWLWGMGAIESKHHNRGSQVNGRRQWWETEPNVGRVADGVAARVDRLKAIGNGQVPLCAAEAWRLLTA